MDKQSKIGRLVVGLLIILIVGGILLGGTLTEGISFVAGCGMSVVMSLLLLGPYFLPTIIACCRGKKNSAAIFLLNLLLGWTFIGWVVALVWAACKD